MDLLERFSFECRKTKTKVITLTNHNSRKQSNQSSKQIHVASVKCGKTRAGKSRLVLVLLLIGRESGEGFFSPITNRSNAKPKELRNYFRHSIEKHSIRLKFLSLYFLSLKPGY